MNCQKHEWVQYVGLTDVFDYCKPCGIKKTDFEANTQRDIDEALSRVQKSWDPVASINGQIVSLSRSISKKHLISPRSSYEVDSPFSGFLGLVQRSVTGGLPVAVQFAKDLALRPLYLSGAAVEFGSRWRPDPYQTPTLPHAPSVSDWILTHKPAMDDNFLGVNRSQLLNGAAGYRYRLTGLSDAAALWHAVFTKGHADFPTINLGTRNRLERGHQKIFVNPKQFADIKSHHQYSHQFSGILVEDPLCSEKVAYYLDMRTWFYYTDIKQLVCAAPYKNAVVLLRD